MKDVVPIGTEVRLKKSLITFWKEEAFSLCARAGVLHDSDAEDYLMRRTLALGTPYQAFTRSIEKNVGDNYQGYLVEIKFSDGLSFTTNIEKRQLKKVKK